MMQPIRQGGFTLIELMITIAIVGILAAIAVPAYQDYTRKARFSEIVLATAPYKTAVAECFQDTNNLTACNSGSNGIPAAMKAEGGISSIVVANGVITATPATGNGIVTDDTLVIAPTATATGRLTWSAAGGAVSKGYVKQ